MSIIPHAVQQLRTTAELRSVPGLLQVLNLLPLSHQEIADRVDAALADNPMLERAPGSPCPNCGRHTRSGGCATCRNQRADQADIASPVDDLSTLAMCEVRADCRAVMPNVIAHLTARGLLDEDPADIAALHNVPRSKVDECIRALRAIGPPGIAQRTVGALLAAQAKTLVDADVCGAWVIELLETDLASIASQDAQGVAGRYGVSEAEARRVFNLIGQRLRPFVSVGGDTEKRSPPDVIAYRDASGDLVVDVAGSAWFGLRVTDVPRELASDPQAYAWLRVHQDRATDLLRQLDSRAHMLSAVARAAVEYQSQFIARGPEAHRPLTRSMIAASLAVSESTVSRAVKDKRLRLPDGRVVALACLFGKSVAARAELEELMRGAPLSDRQLSEQLSARGFSVSRRTVAKYRCELGITTGGPRSTVR
jgi:RNA polymerase sigma-54 factor